VTRKKILFALAGAGFGNIARTTAIIEALGTDGDLDAVPTGASLSGRAR
jgi:hypothetical protein